jgi:cytoskeletal protein CcmA (bactofilin family)
MYQISWLKNENFDATTPSTIQAQIATFYQADIAAIQSLSQVALNLISTGANIVPGNLTISGNLATNGNTKISGNLDTTGNTTINGDLNIKGNTTLNGTVNTVKDLNVNGNFGVPLGRSIFFQNGTGDGVSDTISVNTHDNPALCIVGHGTGNQGRSPDRNIHLWDNVIIDSNLKVKNNINANVITCNTLMLGRWAINSDNNYLYFNNLDTNQGVQFSKDAGCNRLQALNGSCSGGNSHARLEG